MTPEGSDRPHDSGCCAPSASLEDAGVPQPRVLKIRGYDVRFPHKPYPVQMAMMDKTIQALKNSQNVLLELPTGSGKSLSLLCAAAAWHEGTVKEMQEELQAMATKFNFGVAIDGSYMSQQALDLVCKLINESNGGKMDPRSRRDHSHEHLPM